MKIVQNCFQIIFHLEISGIFFLQIHIFAPYKIAKMHQLIFIVNDFLHFYNMQKVKAMKISIVLYYKPDCEQANW